MEWITILLLIVGLVALIAGAELLIRGASRLAAALGVSPLIIGLTVVAFGTSAPELAINLQAAFAGEADLALGNVIGSNIFNILLILGISALIIPLVVHQDLLRLDVPVMIGISILVFLLALDGNLSRWDGVILVAGLALFLALIFIRSRKEKAEIQQEYAQEFGDAGKNGTRRMVTNLVLVLVGLGLLVLGSEWLVEGAVALALFFEISELVIGLTVVAIGTSLPEVATSIVAALRKERDIAFGNVVGSNIFNILSVLGITSLVSPLGINVPAQALAFDMPIMIAVAVATLPVAFTGSQIARWEGGLFLLYFISYNAFLLMEAFEHQVVRAVFVPAMLLFVIPLTVISFGVTFYQEYKHRRP
jgi:cation:H+ antiporter